MQCTPIPAQRIGGAPGRGKARYSEFVYHTLIGQLLGADWQEPGRALDLQLALRLDRLRGPLSLRT